MLQAALICTGLLTALAGDATPSPQDLRTYDAFKLKAGNGPQAQVKLALWCEAHGLDAQRLEHLARAVLSDPGNATARGLLGLVSFGGHWESPERIGERIKADERRAALLAEYNGRRDKLADREEHRRAAVERLRQSGRPEEAYSARLKANRDLAQAHAALGSWCDQKGLKPEAMAHFTTAVHLDASRESSWRHLGYVKRNGRWTSREQAVAEEEDEREQRQANRHWEPLLRKWRGWLGGSSSQREQAEERLAAVTDPRAVPTILKVFPVGGSVSDQSRLVGLLGRIDDPRSSLGLAQVAVRTRAGRVQAEAIEVLRKRPRRDYAGHLVESIRDKIAISVQPVQGPGSRGAMVLDTPRLRVVLTYDAPPAFQLAATFRGYAGYDGNGLPIVVQGRELDRLARDQDPATIALKVREWEARTAGLIALAKIKVQVVQQRMAADVNQVEMLNAQAEADNARVIPVLQAAAGAPADLKESQESWNVWWYDTLGYRYQSSPKVTFVEDVSPSQYPPPTITTCFVAGTPVRTLDGPRPIESIRVGDQVVSQDAATGSLSFQPVVFLHHNPPGETLRVSLSGGGAVVCSVYHRFWRANLGWAMARELRPGDTLRTLGGLVRVAKIEPDETQPLYNLDVARARTFFAGADSLLVHDNTLPDHRLKPFDALPIIEVGRPE
jgi:hypothetical protein